MRWCWSEGRDKRGRNDGVAGFRILVVSGFIYRLVGIYSHEFTFFFFVRGCRNAPHLCSASAMGRTPNSNSREILSRITLMAGGACVRSHERRGKRSGHGICAPVLLKGAVQSAKRRREGARCTLFDRPGQRDKS